MSKTILVVDDDRSNLFMAEKLLKEEYHVISVISGAQALRFLEKKKPELILLDINMPEMSGFDVIKKIKEEEEWRKIPVIFLTADTDSTTEVNCLKLGAVDFIAKPFEPEIMRTRISRSIELEEYRQDLEGAVRRQTQKIELMQHEVIISMANLIESRDGSNGEHVKRTSYYVEQIVNKLFSDDKYTAIIHPEYVHNLVKAAPMHDIGKITVPDNILQKPGRLTAEEFEIMKLHAANGGKIIRETMGKIEEKDYIDIAYNVATYHHEKWDGSGYPEGLKGENIPLEARIMAVADVFDALISKRCYKDAMSLDEAFKIMVESRGTHFDPAVVDAFLDIRTVIESSLKRAGQ